MADRLPDRPTDRGSGGRPGSARVGPVGLVGSVGKVLVGRSGRVGLVARSGDPSGDRVGGLGGGAGPSGGWEGGSVRLGRRVGPDSSKLGGVREHSKCWFWGATSSNVGVFSAGGQRRLVVGNARKEFLAPLGFAARRRTVCLDGVDVSGEDGWIEACMARLAATSKTEEK